MFLFSKTSRLALGPTHLPIHWAPGVISPWGEEVKQQRCRVNHSPLSNVEVQRFDRFEALTAMLLRTQSLLGLLDPQDEGTTILRNINNHSPNDRASKLKDFNPHSGASSPKFI
jgi:hypothetical protein